MNKLIFELFSEEMPANIQEDAAEKLLTAVCDKLRLIGTNLDLEAKSFVTPRRIGFYITNIPNQLINITEEIRGPRKYAPITAINGFMKKYNVQNIDDLYIRDDFYYFSNSQKDLNIKLKLQHIIEEILQEFVWPKSMRWGIHEIRWVRPLHSILCLFNQEILPVKFGHLVASNQTYGHMFMSSQLIYINDPEHYFNSLKLAYIELQPEIRKKIITKGIDEIAKSLSLLAIEDKSLTKEVAGLTEYPVVLTGRIQEKFMHLPPEVLITTLRHHQKYFMFQSHKGDLAPYFAIVANIKSEDSTVIVRGNERVVEARLCDAEFFYKNDKKFKLSDRISELHKLIFHTKIGTVYDKMQSVKYMAIKIANFLGIDVEKVARGAELAKADLVTDMVKEFPELQGVMGYYYAMADNEDKEVATAIKEHYSPRGLNDMVPIAPISAVLALAEKLDTLNQMFTHNIKPTGSKDPYALRRAAIGIIKIMNSNKFNLDLNQLDIRKDVQKFIHIRRQALE